VGPVGNVNSDPVGVPTITGVATEDQILTADASGISDADGLGAFSYQWLRDGVVIGGATSSTYTLGNADVGTQISVQVNYTDGQGTNEGPLTSAQTDPVTDITPEPGGTKFFVVDQSRRMFEYDADGNARGTSQLDSENEKPRGVAASPDGSTLWTINANNEVFVLDSESRLLGSWVIVEVDKSEGITVHGDDLWIVDRGEDRVYFFEGGALRRSGEAEPTSSFRLGRENRNPMDLVTDGSHLWVVNDTRKVDKVFRYTVDGSLEGSWKIDEANAKPTGLTIDPNDVNHVWIVDARSDKAYQYDGATDRTEGEQAASSWFELAESNQNPQGIADPRASAGVGETNGNWVTRESSNQEAILTWDNLANPLDANDDGNVTALDALMVIDHLGRGATDVADLDVDAPYLDVTADGKITARDALAVINGLNRSHISAQAEHMDDAITQLADEDEDFVFDQDFDEIVAKIASTMMV
jgi:hypothetical protein